MEELNVPVNELVRACARSSDAAEWEQFLRRCVPVASLVAARLARLWMGGVTSSIVDDIVQEVFLKLCEQERRILREFKPRGEDSFLGLLRIVASSVASDYFRRHYSAKRGGKVAITPFDEQTSPVLVSDANETAGMQKAVLYSELDRKLRSAPEVIGRRDRAIFWLYYLQGLTAEEIARLPACGLSAKGVESALRRVTQWLRRELEPTKHAGRAEPPEEPS